MNEGSQIPIKPAKGRPMLTWVGKRPLRQVTAYPAQLVETYGEPEAHALPPRPDLWQDWPEGYPHAGLLFHGDNKDVLAHLLANGFRGKVDLIYIDPPFDSGADYVRKVTLRGAAGSAKIDGEAYTLGEQIQYTDIWANDNYLQFMYERLLLLRELLAEEGSVYLHCDYRKVHGLRCLLDEIFGPESFRNEIVWAYSGSARGAKAIAGQFARNHDILLWYARGAGPTYRPTFSERRIPVSEASKAGYRQDQEGRWFKTAPRGDYTDESVAELAKQGRIHTTRSGGIRIKYFLRLEGDYVVEDVMQGDVWTDIPDVMHISEQETSDFPTQKPEQLVSRVICASSNPGDIVLDCFIGSGTTAAVAQKLGRRWIGCDINKGAIQTTAKRLAAIIEEQAARPPTLPLSGGDDVVGEPSPAQLSFAIYRVNEYDLQVQYNEALELACQHIGIARDRKDAFFDGTLGKRLVKIIPFNHPLSPLDLEEVRRELAARPEEDRDVIVVCLGKETAVDVWLEDWNRLRKRGDVPNKIEVIELRTDPRYGGFFMHQPARARVKVRRAGEKTKVEIKDFISPSIIERLKQQAGILTPRIDDWRAMVDSVFIDPAYDGNVFRIALADVPERKTDLVAGCYELDAPPPPTTVAVKITDMLGEEVLVTETV